MKAGDTQKTSLLIDLLINKNRPDTVLPKVNGDALVQDLVNVIKKYVVISDHAALAVALWIMSTWAYQEFNRCPLLLINAPERECGKTQLLKVVGMLVRSPLETANITLAALFRLVHDHRPTLLIDEADTFVGGKSDLAGILNHGYERGGVVVRMETRGNELVKCAYEVYGPKALAGITLERHLPDATMSRGIQVPMKRKTRSDKVDRLRSADLKVFKDLYSRINQFVQDHRGDLMKGFDALPEQLSDRQQDNWEPLLAIAHTVGPKWYEAACEAALEISVETAPTRSSGNQLLEDIREVLGEFEDPRIPSAELLRMLTDQADMAWGHYNHGHPLTPHQMAKLLRGYGIKTKTIRMGPHSTPKGYEVRDFEDAFARYLPERVEAPLPEDDTAPPSAEASTPPEPPNL